MIDTIVFRIHDLNKHEQLYKYCQLQATLNKSLVEKVNVDVPIHAMENVIKLQMSAYQQSGRKMFFSRGNIKMTSSHYECAFRVVAPRNFIEFNFSVPKMVYGTNILQLVKHYNEKDFNQQYYNDYHHNFLDAFDRLKKFMSLFVNKLELECGQKISMYDIELRRLDICYNQVFLNEKDALIYLEQQKRIKKKYVRNDPKNITSYNTSVWVKTENYVAKIYHKGSEYCSVGDRAEHLRANKALGYEHYHINDIVDYDTGEIVQEGLESFSRRILRYEISFTSDYISKIWKAKFFRRKSKRWQMLKKDYAEYHKLESKGKELTCPKDVRLNAHLYNKLFHQTCEFYLRVNRETELYNDSGDEIGGTRMKPYLDKKAPFNRGIFEELIKIFDKFFREFQLNMKLNVSETEQRIDKLNELNTKLKNSNYYDKSKTKRINKAKLLHFQFMLDTHSESELIKRNLYSRMTIYRNKKQLKMLGFIPENILGMYNLPVINDFSEYHSSITMQRVAVANLINSNKYFF